MSSMSPYPLMRIGRRPRAALVDHCTAREAIECEGFVERMRPVLRDRMREDEARGRRRLEAAIAPAAVDVEALDRRLADDRAPVHGHVVDAAPEPHHPQPA